MGMDVHSKLTLYFKINESLKTPNMVEGSRCGNILCHKHSVRRTRCFEKFCGDCGGPMEAISWQDGTRTPNANEFCKAVFGDEDYLTSNFDGLDGTIWLYNRHLQCLKDNGCNLQDILESGGGALDLSKFNAPFMIAEALKEDPQLAEVVPAFYQYFQLPESDPAMITLKFGIVVYYA